MIPRVLAVAVTACAATLLVAGAAFAHVEISPEQVAPGSFGTYTVQVPNEEDAEDTVGLDLTLPKGFLLESAESVPGWRTKVDVGRDGTPARVHWTGGHLTPHTFGQFAITGKVPGRPGTLRFPAVQHYETALVSWNGAEDSEHPAPTLEVSRSAPTTETGRVPLAAAPDPGDPGAAGANGVDDLARARADLAVVLGLAALVGLAGIGALTLIRRRTRPTALPGSPPRTPRSDASGSAARRPGSRPRR